MSGPSVDRRPIVAGNWKMYKTGEEAVEFAHRFRGMFTTQILDGIDVVLCVPFTMLSELAETLADSGISAGAQDLFWETEGAFTGEISSRMLVATGCQYVIIGHSERRQYFGETDDAVNRKVKAALAAGLQPIVCIGERLEERNANHTTAVLERQLAGGLNGLSPWQVSKLIMAYEPVWAIGTGHHATPAQAQEAHAVIREWIRQHTHADIAAQIRIQYGGSVQPANAGALMQQPDVDGALVGGASLNPRDLSDIVKAGLKAQQAAHTSGRT